MTEGEVKNIVIIGGGTAGWLTAGVIAAEHSSDEQSGINITLIESPDVSTVGVGEGTWPTMRETLRKIGISELEFVRQCDVSFKQGSKFVNWLTDKPGDYYYHPFSLPQGYFEANLVQFWQSRLKGISFTDAFTAQSHLCERYKAAKQYTTPEYAAVVNYGYHLDAGKFAAFLRSHCVNKLRVKHILDHVTSINSDADHFIASVSTKENGKVAGDLFIDCTGFTALLIGQHYKVPYSKKSQYLFNDRALATRIPYKNNEDPIASATIATAQDAGWIWDIGLPTRHGIGYVYSSAHCSEQRAENTLRNYIQSTINKKSADQAEIKSLKINPGHRERFWHKNCVAVGMAAGFIEPLEASALALVELSAAMIRDDMPANKSIMAITAQRFNEIFHYRWQRIIDFLKLHYVLSGRDDSDYWRDNLRPESSPDRLLNLLQLWKYQPPSTYDLEQSVEIFPAASYRYVLYGMGFKTELRTTTRRSDNIDIAEKSFHENAQLTKKLMQGLPSNRQLLNQLNEGG